MALLHPENSSPAYVSEAYKLCEYDDPREKAKAEFLLYLLDVELGCHGKFRDQQPLARSIHQIAQTYGTEQLYNAAGGRLYQKLMETGDIDVVWWDVFVAAAHERMSHEVSTGKIAPDARTLLSDLLEKARSAMTTEDAEAILRSVVPAEAAAPSKK